MPRKTLISPEEAKHLNRMGCALWGGLPLSIIFIVIGLGFDNQTFVTLSIIGFVITVPVLIYSWFMSDRAEKNYPPQTYKTYESDDTALSEIFDGDFQYMAIITDHGNMVRRGSGLEPYEVNRIFFYADNSNNHEEAKTLAIEELKLHLSVSEVEVRWKKRSNGFECNVGNIRLMLRTDLESVVPPTIAPASAHISE